MELPRAFAVVLVAAAVGAMATAVSEAASVRQKQAAEIWQEQDRCAKEAFLKFPDYTPAGIRQRNAAMHACDKAHHLPPRPDIGVSPVHRIPDAGAE